MKKTILFLVMFLNLGVVDFAWAKNTSQETSLSQDKSISREIARRRRKHRRRRHHRHAKRHSRWSW